MNNQSIKFISVKISNFRGIPDVLEVPLDVPLTIIHAANGTGKSTICYALEWLLTGKVEDLVGVADFSCEWGQGDTEVSALCRIGSVLYELSRSEVGLYKKEEGKKKIRMKDTELLEMLTPTSVSGNTSHSIAKAKRGWLRNSRWLYSNSLALLVDNNQAGERQKIFADILGLGHYTSTLRELKEYKARLPSVRGLEEEVSNLNKKISELEGNLLAASPWKVQAIENILGILTYFNLQPQSKNLSENFRLAKIQVDLLAQHVSSANSSLSFISNNWHLYKENKKQLDNIRADLLKLSKSNSELTEKQTVFTENFENIDRQLNNNLNAVVWSNECLNSLKIWDNLLANKGVSQFLKIEDMTIENLQSFVEFTWSDDRKLSWLNAVDYLIENTEFVLHLVRQKQQLDSNIVHPPADLAEVSRILKEAQQSRIKAESEFNVLTSVLERFKAIAREVVQPDSSICPLCHHDWKHSEHLQAEIAKEEFAPELINASKKLDNARNVENEQLLKFKITNIQKASYEKYIEDVRSVDSQLAQVALHTKYLETMRVSDFSKFNAENIIYLQQRIRTAIDLKKLIDTVIMLEQFFKLETNNSIIGLRVNAVVLRIEEYKKVYGESIKVIETNRQDVSAKLSNILNEIKAKANEIEEKNKISSFFTKTIIQFEEHWKIIGENHTISQEVYNEALANNNQKSGVVDKFQRLLNECEVIVSSENDESYMLKLKSDLEVLNKKLLAGKSYISRADRTIKHYEEFVRDETKESLSPLLSPASEFFSRMHANEVYRKLSVSNGEDALKWTVFADGFDDALDAEEKFSQGQRQDLALSLYLAKACSTGGSFFLDEPIAHLDDLNRVAMLDIFRLLATSKSDLNLVLTTASDGLARHLVQKFSSIKDQHLLNIIHLDGNPRSGVKATVRKNISA